VVPALNMAPVKSLRGALMQKIVSVKSFCLAGSGEEKLVFYIELKIK